MEIPEIQYNPEQVSAPFNPVTQVDITPGLKRNREETSSQLNARLNQISKDGATAVQNVKSNAFPVEELKQFSSTLSNLMDEKVKTMKEDLENEMAYLAFTDGVESDPVFEENEKQMEETGRAYNTKANNYQAKTGDVEGAERIRNLSGWRKYYYMKAKTQNAAQGFGSWMTANSTNPEYSVNGHTLDSAPDSATRQAVAAKMASVYMRPYQGLNKSFLGKYMYPNMQKGMTVAVGQAAAKSAERIKANNIDAAKANFLAAEDKTTAAQDLRSTLTATGDYTEAQIRGEIVSMATQVKTSAEFEAIMSMKYGPNGLSFKEQYWAEYNEAKQKHQALRNTAVTANQRERDIQENKKIEAAEQAWAKDMEDGTADVNPERLKELALNARQNGDETLAKWYEGKIDSTAWMINSKNLVKQYEQMIASGIAPSRDEILQNPALDWEDKQKLITKAKEAGGAEPKSEQVKSHKKQMAEAIKKRGGYQRDGANHPGIEAMEFRAWQEYKQVYAQEFERNGGNAAMAAKAAMDDFLSKFGTDPLADGPYRLGSVGKKDDKIYHGKYVGYNPFGTESTAESAMSQIDEKLKYQDINRVITEMPDLFEGEEKMLQDIAYNLDSKGNVGIVPPVYYDLVQRYGGQMDMIDLINKRLEANGLDPLPDEVQSIIKPVRESFDEESYKYLSYKPNTTRTDIGLINSGIDPIYAGKVPAAVADDVEFQAAVTDTAGRLGIPEEHLYAAMSFETGGTFNPGITNAAGSGATGLIQFMPSTAQGLGTSTGALAGMSRARQMHYVEKYLSNKGIGPNSSLDDVYMAILFPAAVGKGDDYVLFGQGAMSGYTGRAYDQNRGLDKNGDGSITKKEAAQKVIDHRNNMSPWRKPMNVRPGL